MSTKIAFLAEFVNTCSTESLPLMVGVISILSEILQRKIMIIIIVDGHCFSMPV